MALSCAGATRTQRASTTAPADAQTVVDVSSRKSSMGWCCRQHRSATSRAWSVRPVSLKEFGKVIATGGLRLRLRRHSVKGTS